MKLLRVVIDGLPLFKGKVDLSFYASQRVDDEQSKALYPLFSNVYLNPTNGFIGINASGKTSILKALLLCFGILNSEPINHIDNKNILGDAKRVAFDIYFYSETTKEICLLKTLLTSNRNASGENRYDILEESLYLKSANEAKTKKSLFDFDGRRPYLMRSQQEEFLPGDVSIIISRNKKTKENIYVVDMLKFTNENVLVTAKEVPLEVISFLDPTIEKLHVENINGNTLIHLKFKGKEEVVLNNANELGAYLSSGTIKGMLSFSLAAEVLKNGGCFIIDEIENHFNKEIVVTLLRLFMDRKLNKSGGMLIYSTHYPEILDEYERNDSLFVTANQDGIVVNNLSNLLSRNDIKKSDAYESGMLGGTAPSYESYMRLKKYFASSID